MGLIAWIFVVLLAVVSQWYIIEKKKVYPNKLLWFVIRAAVAGGFLVWYNELGYVWYWSLIYMAGTFWLPFNESLNYLRGKPFGYLSPKNSFVDRMIVKYLPGGAFAYVSFAFIFFLFAVINMIVHGQMTWAEINGI